jgi:hypothetical protein
MTETTTNMSIDPPVSMGPEGQSAGSIASAAPAPKQEDTPMTDAVVILAMNICIPKAC